MESFRNDISDNLNITISGNQITESIGELLSVMRPFANGKVFIFLHLAICWYSVHYHVLCRIIAGMMCMRSECFERIMKDLFEMLRNMRMN